MERTGVKLSGFDVHELGNESIKLMLTRADVHAELGEVVAGLKPGRASPQEVIIFDSTGTALQDAAAAAIGYERAVQTGGGARLNFTA